MSLLPPPWGVHTIRSMYPGLHVNAGLPNGQIVLAVAEPYHLWTLREKLRGAWWVVTGRAHAVIWPKPGDIEAILHEGFAP